MTVLAYLKQELNGDGGFVKSYRALSSGDKESLKATAVKEMKALGIKVGNGKKK